MYLGLKKRVIPMTFEVFSNTGKIPAVDGPLQQLQVDNYRKNYLEQEFQRVEN